jgi:hypothetical protein
MTESTPWHHHAPAADPREVARRFVVEALDMIDGRPRRIGSFGVIKDITGHYHGIFTVEGEDQEFEISGDAEGEWNVEAIR